MTDRRIAMITQHQKHVMYYLFTTNAGIRKRYSGRNLFVLLFVLIVSTPAFSQKVVEGGAWFACPGETHILGKHGVVNASPFVLCVEVWDDTLSQAATAEFWFTGFKNEDLGHVTGRQCFEISSLPRKLKAGTIAKPSYIYISTGDIETVSIRRERDGRSAHIDGFDPCRARCLQTSEPALTSTEKQRGCIYKCDETTRGVNSDWDLKDCLPEEPWRDADGNRVRAIDEAN